MLRIPHCLDSRVTDGVKVVSITHRLLSTPQKSCLSLALILLAASKPQGLVRLEELGKLIKIVHVIGPRICDLQACILVA
jgi:hypothetical protein